MVKRLRKQLVDDSVQEVTKISVGLQLMILIIDSYGDHLYNKLIKNLVQCSPTFSDCDP